jgi:hypothetical protein
MRGEHGTGFDSILVRLLGGYGIMYKEGGFPIVGEVVVVDFYLAINC